MKKHNMMRVASALAVVTLLSTSLISGTLAKYTSSVSVSDTARVAKWSFEVGSGNDIVKNDTFTFNLFNTTYDNVTSSNGEKLIAPGTMGKAQIDLINTSEVEAKYTISFAYPTENATGMADLPLKYALTSTSEPPTEEKNWQKNLNTLASESGNLNANSSDPLTYYLHWKWDFDGDDTTDTNLGKAETLQTLTIQANVTAEQVD